MKIRFIPETEAEIKRFGGSEYIEHANCKEYFIAGNKVDQDGSLSDFHEWNGSFRYLLGTLSYFYELVNDDRKKKRDNDESFQLANKKGRTSGLIKRSEGGKIEPLDFSMNFLGDFKDNSPKPTEPMENGDEGDTLDTLDTPDFTDKKDIRNIDVITDTLGVDTRNHIWGNRK